MRSSDWQPMETAPLNPYGKAHGPVVLIWDRANRNATSAYYEPMHGWRERDTGPAWVLDDFVGDTAIAPEDAGGWMPLAAPEGEAPTANAIIDWREENGRFSGGFREGHAVACGILARVVENDGDAMRVAVNAMTPILRSDMDASAWNTVSEMRDALIAALRAIEEITPKPTAKKEKNDHQRRKGNHRMNSIDMSFDPGKHIDKWGFVWEDTGAIDGGAWRICQVFLDDCDQLFIRVWDQDSPDEPVIATEEAMAGQPYLPLIWPKADPGAGLEVTMRLNGGASATHTIIKPGPKAEAIKDAVAAALFPRPDRQTQDLEALRTALANAPEDDCGNDKLCADACNAIGELRLSLRLALRRLDQMLAENAAKKEPTE